MICVTTRFQLNHFWDIVPMYLTYRRMRRELDAAPGLIRYAFLVQGPVACCTLSIWESDDALAWFSKRVPSHVGAARLAKVLCRGIWSGYWRIDAVSRHASSWEGPDLWPALVAHPVHPHLLIEAGSEGTGRYRGAAAERLTMG